MTQPQKNLENAYQAALESLRSCSLEAAARNCGATLTGQVLTVPVLCWVAKVDVAAGTVNGAEGGDVPPRVKVLVLRYLAAGGNLGMAGAGTVGHQIGFTELTAGVFYKGPFDGRVTLRLAREFGGELEDFLKCAMELGGHRAKPGDASWTFRFFPKVPITVILWRGDEELPPGASVVFDASIHKFMDTEEVVVACEELAAELVRRRKMLRA